MKQGTQNRCNGTTLRDGMGKEMGVVLCVWYVWCGVCVCEGCVWCVWVWCGVCVVWYVCVVCVWCGVVCVCVWCVWVCGCVWVCVFARVCARTGAQTHIH